MDQRKSSSQFQSPPKFEAPGIEAGKEKKSSNKKLFV